MKIRDNRKAFTLIELLTVIVLLGLILTLTIPALRNLTYNGAEKQYQYHQKLVHEAAKLYAKNYRGELNNESSSCFNIPYQSLIQEGLIEEEDTICSGSVILERRNSDGYNYNYYLTCKDISGKQLHNSDPIPLACKGIHGSFKIEYALYKDGPSGRESYTEGEWAKYIYGEYNTSSPYNYPLDYFEYSADFVNWVRIDERTHTYTNYNGNIFVRAVDTGGNVSESIRHLIRGDSIGPTFSLSNNENGVTEDDKIEVSIMNVEDVGIGVNEAANIYSIDGVTWTNNPSWTFPLNSNATIYVQDQLGNISSQEVQIVRACNSKSGSATAADVVEGKTVWIGGEKIIGTMKNNGGVTKELPVGSQFIIAEGYHDGTGKISVSGLSENTKATASAAHIVSGKTAWVNGEKLTGTLPNVSKGNQVLNLGDSYTIAPGYHNGKETIRVKSLMEHTQADATADNLSLGVSAWVNGAEIIGTGADKEAWYQKGYVESKNRCTADLTNMKTSVKFINNGTQTQTFTFTIATANYTKLHIGDITTTTVDHYKIRLNCSGNSSEVLYGDKNQVIDISPYNSITVTIEIEKTAALGADYLGGEGKAPQIIISYMYFD